MREWELHGRRGKQLVRDYLILLDAVRVLLNSGTLEGSTVSVDRQAYEGLEDIHYEQVCRWMEGPNGENADEIDLRNLLEDRE